jgi:type IV pilus assembly protein PilN
VAKHGEIKERLAELGAREAAIQKLQAARTGPTMALLELSKIMSGGRGPTVDPVRLETLRRENPTALPNASWDTRRIWLTQYTEAERSVKIAGRARDGEDVSELVRRIGLSSLFGDVQLLPAQKAVDTDTKMEVLGFQISAKAKY